MKINHIDLKGSKLENLDIKQIKNHKATLIKGARIENKLDYVLFAHRFGNILPYGEGAITYFKGIAQDEIEIHYDGISAKIQEKLPHWLIFHVKQSCPKVLGGQFNICDSESILETLDNSLKDRLANNKLQFYGYFQYQIDAKEYESFSFEIDPIQIFNKRKSLRIFLPSLTKRKVPDTLKLFSNTDLEETNRIFNQLRESIYSNDVITGIDFEENDVLILDNRFTLHGRKLFIKPTSRCLHRIQTLGEGSEPYSLDIENYKANFHSIDN